MEMCSTSVVTQIRASWSCNVFKVALALSQIQTLKPCKFHASNRYAEPTLAFFQIFEQHFLSTAYQLKPASDIFLNLTRDDLCVLIEDL